MAAKEKDRLIRGIGKLDQVDGGLTRGYGHHRWHPQSRLRRAVDNFEPLRSKAASQAQGRVDKPWSIRNTSTS